MDSVCGMDLASEGSLPTLHRVLVQRKGDHSALPPLFCVLLLPSSHALQELIPLGASLYARVPLALL